MAELLTCQSNCWRVYDWGHFFDVVEKKPVEEDLVRVLQRTQVNVPLQVVSFSFVRLIGADDLFIKLFYLGWKKPVQAKFRTLIACKGCALVQNLPIEEIHAQRNIRPTFSFDGRHCDHMRILSFWWSA